MESLIRLCRAAAAADQRLSTGVLKELLLAFDERLLKDIVSRASLAAMIKMLDICPPHMVKRALWAVLSSNQRTCVGRYSKLRHIIRDRCGMRECVLDMLWNTTAMPLHEDTLWILIHCGGMTTCDKQRHTIVRKIMGESRFLDAPVDLRKTLCPTFEEFWSAPSHYIYHDTLAIPPQMPSGGASPIKEVIRIADESWRHTNSKWLERCIVELTYWGPELLDAVARQRPRAISRLMLHAKRNLHLLTKEQQLVGIRHNNYALLHALYTDPAKFECAFKLALESGIGDQQIASIFRSTQKRDDKWSENLGYAILRCVPRDRWTLAMVDPVLMACAMLGDMIIPEYLKTALYAACHRTMLLEWDPKRAPSLLRTWINKFRACFAAGIYEPGTSFRIVMGRRKRAHCVHTFIEQLVAQVPRTLRQSVNV